MSVCTQLWTGRFYQSLPSESRGVRTGGRGGELPKDDSGTGHGHCTHQLTAAVLAHTKSRQSKVQQGRGGTLRPHPWRRSRRLMVSEGGTLGESTTK